MSDSVDPAQQAGHQAQPTAPVQPQQAQAESSVQPPAAPAGLGPEERNARAIHESAHAVVGHELGATVNWINLDNHPNPKLKFQTKTDSTWPVDPAKFYLIDKLDQREIGIAREWARRMVACFVAGEVAEFAGTEKQLISHPGRIPIHYWEGGPAPKEKTDRGRVPWLLSSVGIYETGEIAPQEQRAREILKKRKARHDYLVHWLLENGYIGGEDLKKGLSL